MSTPENLSDGDGLRPVAATIDETLTSFARLVRGPRLAAAMGSEAAAPIESSLYPVLVGIVDLGPLRLSALADHITLQMSTLSRHASELQSRGLIRRETDPDDNRAAYLTATQEGLRLVERVRLAWWSTVEQVTADWTDAELDGFVRAMNRFRFKLLETLEHTAQR